MVVLESVEAQLQSLDSLIRGIGQSTVNEETDKPQQREQKDGQTAARTVSKPNVNAKRTRPTRKRAQSSSRPREENETKQPLESHNPRSRQIKREPSLVPSSLPSQSPSIERKPTLLAEQEKQSKASSVNAFPLLVEDDLLARAREFVRQANALFPDQKETANPPPSNQTKTPSPQTDVNESSTSMLPSDAIRSNNKTDHSFHTFSANEPCIMPDLQDEDKDNMHDTDSVASADSLVTPRVAPPPHQFMWIPLSAGGMTARGSNSVYFRTDIREANMFKENTTQDLLICGNIYKVSDIEVTGTPVNIKLTLDKSVANVPSIRDRTDQGLVKVFAKVHYLKVDQAQQSRARRAGKGHIFGLQGCEEISVASAGANGIARSTRGREATERKSMAAEDAAQRKLEADQQRLAELELKAEELKKKTKARIQEQARVRRAAEKAKEDALEKEKAEREEQEAARQERIRQAAELSQRRIAMHRRKQQAQTRKHRTDEDENQSTTQSRCEAADLVAKSQERVRQRKESLRAAQEAMAKQEGYAPPREYKSRMSEEDIRKATKERRQRFLKIAKNVRQEEEQRYQFASRKPKPRPESRSHVNIPPSPRQSRFPPISNQASEEEYPISSVHFVVREVRAKSQPCGTALQNYSCSSEGLSPTPHKRGSYLFH